MFSGERGKLFFQLFAHTWFKSSPFHINDLSEGTHTLVRMESYIFQQTTHRWRRMNQLWNMHADAHMQRANRNTQARTPVARNLTLSSVSNSTEEWGYTCGEELLKSAKTRKADVCWNNSILITDNLWTVCTKEGSFAPSGTITTVISLFFFPSWSVV